MTILIDILKDCDIEERKIKVIVLRSRAVLENGVPERRQYKFSDKAPLHKIAQCGAHNTCRDKMMRSVREFCKLE